ncbi:BatE protein [Bacteroidia bacterium]|nr:BatE protein [Bacteroidia bacterium]
MNKQSKIQWTFALWVVLLFSTPLLSATPVVSFLQANQNYVDGNYAEAERLYSHILDSGVESAEIYFNLGNCYFRMGNYPQAILNYERARRLDKHDPAIITNLKITRTKLIDRFEELPDVFFVRWWKQFTGLMSYNSWAILFLSLFFFCFCAIALYLTAAFYAVKIRSFYVAVALFVMSGICFTSAVYEHALLSKEIGIVSSNKVGIYSVPNNTNQKFTVNSGTKVEVLDKVGNYWQVRTSDGNSGWIDKTVLMII